MKKEETLLDLDFDPFKPDVTPAGSAGVTHSPMSQVSSGFFDERDPDFKECFTRGKYSLNNSYYRYRMCDAASADWNYYLMEKFCMKVL